MDTTCRLCGLAPESNWHVLAECAHPTMTSIRTKLMTQIVDSVAKLPLPGHVQQLVSLNWLVSDSGVLVDLANDAALADIMRTWAPELADRIEATDLRHRLLWDSPQGKHNDDLRKWAFRGVLPAQWVQVMYDLGVSREVAQRALAEVETVVCGVVPELWREFCAKIHDAEGKVRTKGLLAQEIDLLFATWDGPIPQRLPQDVRKWTPKRQRQWAAGVRRARRRRLALQAPLQEEQRPLHRPITTYYRRALAPPGGLPFARPAPSLESRGRAFARAAALRRRSAAPQPTLRDFGWEPLLTDSPSDPSQQPLVALGPLAPPSAPPTGPCVTALMTVQSGQKRPLRTDALTCAGPSTRRCVGTPVVAWSGCRRPLPAGTADCAPSPSSDIPSARKRPPPEVPPDDPHPSPQRLCCGLAGVSISRDLVSTERSCHDTVPVTLTFFAGQPGTADMPMEQFTGPAAAAAGGTLLTIPKSFHPEKMRPQETPPGPRPRGRPRVAPAVYMQRYRAFLKTPEGLKSIARAKARALKRSLDLGPPPLALTGTAQAPAAAAVQAVPAPKRPNSHADADAPPPKRPTNKPRGIRRAREVLPDFDSAPPLPPPAKKAKQARPGARQEQQIDKDSRQGHDPYG